MSIEPTARVRLAKDVLMQKIGDEAILLNLNAENYFAFGEVGTRLIATLQKGNSLNQAVRKLMGKDEVAEMKPSAWSGSVNNMGLHITEL